MSKPLDHIDGYARRKQIELGLALADVLKVYLDTNFWIKLRDAHLGRSTHAASLLKKLRSAAAAGQIVCPISESTFIELFRQRDLATRRATAELIDQLGFGISLIDPERRIATEVGYFVFQAAGSIELHPLDALIWTKVGYILGMQHPIIDGLDKSLSPLVEQGCFDAVWDATLSSMVASIGETPLSSHAKFEDLATKLNQESPLHSGNLKSFKDAYRAEAAGVSSLVGKALAEAITQVGIYQGKLQPNTPAPDGEDPGLLGWKNLVAIALSDDKGDARTVLRSLHTQVSLHAAIRWDKPRKFRANDFPDFNHAAAALSYCDAFFTDGPLQVLIQQNQVMLDRYFNCRLASNLIDAENQLDAMLKPLN